MAIAPKLMSTNLHKTRYRSLLFLVTAALLVQSLFPNGTMPGNLSGGWVATLCPEGMPVGFMAQLPLTQSIADPHAGHHGHHGIPGVDHSDGHQAVGDCQLGTQIDQPFTLTSPDVPGPAVLADLAPVLNRATALIAHQVYRQQPRAPPLS